MTRFIFIFLIALLTLTLSGPNTTQAQQSSDTVHTVQLGETLYSISRTYDVTVDELRRWNNLDSDQLSRGQSIIVAPPDGDNRIVHVVEAGESMFGISRMYNVSIAEIQQWNNLETSNVNSGQELIIYESDQDTAAESIPPPEELPEPTEEMDEIEEIEDRESIVRRAESTPGSTTYTVRTGDSLFQIAREHDMSVDELMELNNMDSDMLRVGQRILVKETRSTPSIAETAEESTPQGRFVRYRVEQGESGRDILQKFRMNESELRALNPGIQIQSISSGQQLTVLLPPNRNFKNPYRQGASLEDLGEVAAYKYSDSDVAGATTSGELYNPDQLTAAHSNMALGNVIYVENPSNGRGVMVKVNDRYSGDGLKLSHRAFDMLGFSSVENARVTIYLDN